MHEQRKEMPPKDIKPKELMIDDQRNIEERAIVWTSGRLITRVQKLPNALDEHLGDVAERVKRRVLQNLKTVVINKLSIKRIQVSQRGDRQCAKQQQPLLLIDARSRARFLAASFTRLQGSRARLWFRLARVFRNCRAWFLCFLVASHLSVSNSRTHVVSSPALTPIASPLHDFFDNGDRLWR